MGHAYANYFSITYIMCYRKKPKTNKQKKKKKKKEKKKLPFHFLAKNAFNHPPSLRQMKQFPSRTCCKHRRRLPYYYWPVIAVL